MHPNLRTLTHTPIPPFITLSAPRPPRLGPLLFSRPCARSLHSTSRLMPRQTPTALSSGIRLSALRNTPSTRSIAYTASAPDAMFSHPPPEPGADFNLVMIGAGNIMFGSDEGPWNHSFRFEHKLGPRLKVTALIDPAIARSEAVLEGKRQSFVESAYRDTKTYKTIEDYYHALKKSGKPFPDAIVIGCPPAYRGGTTKGTDLEIQLLKHFPQTAYFVEKPVGTGTIEAAKTVTDALIKNGNIVSVGYMLRYLRCVQKMKQIIHENNLTVMATNARYSCAYEAIAKPAWWNKAIDMGPVIEQGTHFCDLSRYFGGDVDIDSVSAKSVEFYEAPGKLSKVPVDESLIPEDQRIPRLTSAIWKYKDGAVGSFTHAVALQGTAYACELEVWADGYLMRLVDPYNAPTLYVRRPGDDHEERHVYTDDDPFFSEVSSFIDSIEGGPDPHILSSFEDATKTYELTWAIRLASEASRAPRVQ
ncbi:putative oxidoreductase C terminal-domain-containing protein [Dioszegia hungarica]|uniref:Oxidoreductase C terminal-domain-containing protein n=1 Tax=Dioszegia hungarica TaxID=4972 RepID=A0AA38LXK6_9TREE|nr:putative oxidoreductase C terminal-domain-containing protein [Dioszegia hungarica]KAI9638084.1 putative oxidoreductase C terminal-domain-containing protein [Dioszegia hungarica]